MQTEPIKKWAGKEVVRNYHRIIKNNSRINRESTQVTSHRLNTCLRLQFHRNIYPRKVRYTEIHGKTGSGSSGEACRATSNMLGTKQRGWSFLVVPKNLKFDDSGRMETYMMLRWAIFRQLYNET